MRCQPCSMILTNIQRALQFPLVGLEAGSIRLAYCIRLCTTHIAWSVLVGQAIAVARTSIETWMALALPFRQNCQNERADRSLALFELVCDSGAI